MLLAGLYSWSSLWASSDKDLDTDVCISLSIPSLGEIGIRQLLVRVTSSVYCTVLLLSLCNHFNVSQSVNKGWFIYSFNWCTSFCNDDATVIKMNSNGQTGSVVQGFSRIFATLMNTFLWITLPRWGVMVHQWSANLSEVGKLCPLLQQPQDMRCWSDFYNQFTRAGGINPVHSLILSLPLALSLSNSSSPPVGPLLIVRWIIQQPMWWKVE